MGQFNPFGDGNGSGNVYDNLEAGVNILIEKTIDGKAKISASGEISSEDTVARADIAAIKNGETLDSFGDVELALDNKADLDKVYSKSDVDTALNNKADKSTIYTKTEIDTVLETKANTADVYSKSDINAALNNKVDKETGKGLSTNDYTDSEKTKLNSLVEIKTIGTGLNLDNNGELTATGGPGGTTDYDDLSNKPQINGNTLSGNKTSAQLGLASTSDIPATLAELTDDATHRTVSDAEKSAWNAKQNALTTEQLAAVNSGITSSAVEQIETNKNNISYNINNGVKNVVPLKSSINTGDVNITFTQNADKSYTLTISATTSANIGFDISDTFTLDSTMQYVLSGNPSSGAVRLVLAEGVTPFNWIDQQYSDSPKTITPVANKLYKLSVFIYSNTSVTTLTLKPMMCPKSLYDADSTYQPYALSNATITPALQECVDNGVKNLVAISDSTITGSNYVFDNVPCNIPAGSYIFSYTSNQSTQGNVELVVKNSSGTTITSKTVTSSLGRISIPFTISETGSKLTLYSVRAGTYSNFMICEKSLYDVSSTFEPYALSNAELTSKALMKQTILQTNDDFNSATSSGMYKFNGGPANNPAGSSGAYGILLVITFDNYIMQLCYDFLNGVYYRNKVSSWSAWTKFN